MDTKALMAAGITAAAVFAAWKFGNGFVKTAAAGVAGLMIVNQLPMVRDGVNVKLIG